MIRRIPLMIPLGQRLLVVALLVCCASTGWSFTTTYSQLTHAGQGPEDQARLTRHGSFIAGYFINFDHFQFYTGTTESLNALLADYARISDTSHTVVRHSQAGKVEYQWRTPAVQDSPTDHDHDRASTPADWRLNRYSRSWPRLADYEATGVLQTGYDITIDVWTGGGRIDWNDITVPEGIEVREALPNPGRASQPK